MDGSDESIHTDAFKHIAAGGTNTFNFAHTHQTELCNEFYPRLHGHVQLIKPAERITPGN